MVKNTALLLFIIVFISGLIASILFPFYTINPGVMIEDHQMMKNDCLSCHSLGKGVITEKCIVCHELSDIGLVLASGIKRGELNFKSNNLHQSIIDIRCNDCHTEHNGLSRENATLNFKHDVLKSEAMKKCYDCHSLQKPEDDLHELLILDCSECHSTEAWKPSHFKHELLGELKSDCQSCHENKKPIDVLHSSIGKLNQCLECHTTESWKPSTFDHTKYFLFDSNHPSNCSDCHNVNQTLAIYSCYNCHEHNRAKIKKEHLKEGIRNFTNCVECHRSGNEDDAKGKERDNRRRDEN